MRPYLMVTRIEVIAKSLSERDAIMKCIRKGMERVIWRADLPQGPYLENSLEQSSGKLESLIPSHMAWDNSTFAIDLVGGSPFRDTKVTLVLEYSEMSFTPLHPFVNAKDTKNC